MRSSARSPARAFAHRAQAGHQGHRGSGARVAGAATGCTSMMVELNHVPLGARRDSWSDGHRPTVPSARESDLRFFPFRPPWDLLKMEAAYEGRASAHAHVVVVVVAERGGRGGGAHTKY